LKIPPHGAGGLKDSKKKSLNEYVVQQGDCGRLPSRIPAGNILNRRMRVHSLSNLVRDTPNPSILNNKKKETRAVYNDWFGRVVGRKGRKGTGRKGA